MLAAAGILTIGTASPSFARGGRVAAAAGAGLVAGAVIGAAAANANSGYYASSGYYNGNGYYDDYAYEPVYSPAPVYGYEPAPAYGYAADSYAYVPGPSINRSFSVHDDKGQYVGSDPDPRVRAHMKEDARDR
jgi:hypothetical protein